MVVPSFLAFFSDHFLFLDFFPIVMELILLEFSPALGKEHIILPEFKRQ